MRKVYLEKDVYKFEELTEQAKGKAKQDYLNDMRTTQIFSEDVSELIKTKYDLNLEPNYSLNYCQGDGFALKGTVYIDDLLNNENTLELIKKEFTEKEIKRMEFIVNECLSETIELRISGHYTHKYSIDFEEYLSGGYFRKEDLLENTYDKFIKWFKEFIYNLCDDFEKDGYNYFYEVEDCEIEGYFEDNNIEFYKDGTIF